MLSGEGRDTRPGQAASWLVRVKHPGSTCVHYVRAEDFDRRRAKQTDDGATALCGDMATKDEPWAETVSTERVCNFCHARACNTPGARVRSKWDRDL